MSLQRLKHLDHLWTERLSIAERPGPMRWIAVVLAHSGDSWFWLAGLGIMAWTSDGVWRVWAIGLAAAILVTAIVVMGLKFTIRRRRPEGPWGGVYRRTDPHSFPSGHAARAILIAVIVLLWGPTWLGPIIVVWAPLVLLARVAMGVHYLSDVIAGAALGLSFGLAAGLLYTPL
ncbi:MAG: phosphatase PAP2 family protein [Anaerolineales bacterium]|nr:phosphatase PAP2 family protein [Anaerolineales bacterium]